MAIVTLDTGVYQRLQTLSTKMGQSPEAVLDRALADYEHRLLGESAAICPRADPEAELLDDPGRIRIPPRQRQAISACVESVGRQPVRIFLDDED